MKRYGVFAWYDFDAYGGMHDLECDYDDLDDALKLAAELREEGKEVQVFDFELGQEVELR